MRKMMSAPVLVGIGVILGLWWKDLDVHAARGGAVPAGNGDVNGDGAIDLSDSIYILTYLFTAGDPPVPIECPPPAKGSLSATGQNQCFDANGFEIDCQSADYPGQDGFYQTGCPMADRFVDNGDGTVTDTCTGLEWMQEPAPELAAWQQALQDCEDLDFAGHHDWRLPNLRELQSLADYGRADPGIDPIFTSGSDGFWSSSTYLGADPGGAWVIDFYDGYVDYDYTDAEYFVRPVRGGT